MGKKQINNSSSVRARRTLRNYVMSNPWRYFLTITFALDSVRNDYEMAMRCLDQFTRHLRDKCHVDYLLAMSYCDSTGIHIHGVVSDYPTSLLYKLDDADMLAWDISVKTDGVCYQIADEKKFGFGMTLMQEIVSANDCFRLSSYMENNLRAFLDYVKVQGIQYLNAYRHSRGLQKSSSRRLRIIDKKTGQYYEAVLYHNGNQSSAILYPSEIGDIDNQRHDRFRSRKLQREAIRISGSEQELLSQLQCREDIEVEIESGVLLQRTDRIEHIMVPLSDYLNKGKSDEKSDSSIGCVIQTLSVKRDDMCLCVPLSSINLTTAGNTTMNMIANKPVHFTDRPPP